MFLFGCIGITAPLEAAAGPSAELHRSGSPPSQKLARSRIRTIVFLLPIEMLRLVATGPSKTPQT